MGTKFSIVFRCFGAVALLALAAGLTPQPASAQTCLQNEYNQVQRQKLNCTANDVRIAAVANIRDPQTGAKLTSCIAGATFNFLADFEIVTSSSSSRENIGLYIATNSQTTALTGACVDHIISPRHPCATNTSLNCGSDNYHETDAPPDNCGDTSSGDNSGTFGAGAELVTLEIDNFLCEAPAGSTQVQLPNCTSWQIPGGTIQCVSTSPDTYPFNGPGGTPTAIPGSPSKCNCGIIPLGITVQTPGIDVGKACNTAYTTTSPTFAFSGTQLTGSPASCTTSCTPGGTCNPVNYEGGNVTYTVDIANDKSNFGSVTVSQICDTAYGQIFPAPPSSGGPVTGGTCNAGSQCLAPNNVTGSGCATGTTCTAATIAFGASHTCTFTATQAESSTVTNIASALVTGGSSGTASGGSNSVMVTSGEAPSTATVTKGLNATTHACVTERYKVDVASTSTADETLSLTALNDTASDFGNITTVQGNILGTTCGQTAGLAGAGSLSTFTVVAPGGTEDATHLQGGALPDNLTVGGSDYVCYFDAQLCSDLSTSSNNCFTHTNSINATMAGDEKEAVTINANSVTAKVCVTVAPQ